MNQIYPPFPLYHLLAVRSGMSCIIILRLSSLICDTRVIIRKAQGSWGPSFQPDPGQAFKESWNPPQHSENGVGKNSFFVFFSTSN